MANIKQINVGGSSYNVVDAAGRVMLATVESSTTASKAYAIGDFFILNDVLYQVTKAIESAGTIVVSGESESINAVQTTLGANIVQADFNEIDTASKAFIKNKPTLGTAAARNAGTANGVAELDEYGKVPSSQLPSFVDDVIEGYLNSTDGKFYKENTYTTEITGESGKIYVDLSTEKTYRWGGTAFAVISETLALGETSTTAYRGDRGKVAYEISTNSVATIEESATASKAYSAGDYLVYENTLYKVTADISIGGTITAGTNVEATKIGDQLTAQKVTFSVSNEVLTIS